MSRSEHGRQRGLSVWRDDGCNRIYASWVDAKNAFGVKVRTRFECKFDPRTGLYGVKVQP
jgi:hypothetical protein